MLNHLEKLVETLDTDRIRADAVRILDKVGMLVPMPDVVRRLRSAGVRVEGGRMLLEPGRTDAYIERHRAAAPEEPEEQPLRLSSGSHCLYEFCPQEHVLKPLTLPGLERWAKLIGALHADGTLASSCCVGTPSDCPKRLAPLWQQFVSARFFPDPPMYAYSPDYVPYVTAMAAVLSKELSTGVHPISPLVLGGEELSLALRLLDDGALGSTSCAPMPVMGVTAPLDWVAAWSQSVAEAVGTAIALEAMGVPRASAFATLYAADMRNGAFVFGSAEHVVATLAEAKVNREILGNLRRAAKAVNTSAKVPGEQAAIEKTAHTLAALLAGYRTLGGMGQLAVDEVFSPEQLFIDLDIVEHAWRIARGTEREFSEGDVVSLVREGLTDQHFLTTDTTLARFRGFHASPGTFDRRSTGSWLAAPAPESGKAWELAQAKMASYDYELDEDRQRDLRRIIADADRVLRD